MRKIQTVIIDDHRIVSDGLTRVLNADGRVEVVGTAASLKEAQALSQHVEPDAVLVDLKLPDAQGFDAIPAAKRMFPGARIVAMTGFGDVAKSAAERHGADAFLSKELASDLVTRTICGLFPEAAESSDPLAALSKRELEIARLVANGLTNDEISGTLSLSPNTVKTHVASVFHKLKLRRRVDLALFWNRQKGSE